jgi:glycosyltransferase involved in cell wall biosynthesis
MKVLQINTERGWRGGERQTLYAVQGLLAEGVEVGLLCRAGSDLERAGAEAGARIHAARSTAGALALLGVAGRRYNVLHAQTGRGHSLAMLARPLHRRPVLVTRRVNFVHRGRFARWKYRRTERVVAISGAVRETLERMGVEDVVCISSAAHRPEPDPLRAERFAREQGLEGVQVVATTSAVVPHKDPEATARAAAELIRRRGDVLFLHFGGCPDPALEGRVRRILAEEGVEERYRLLGHVKGVEALFPLFHLYLATGDETEGLNSSIYDAFLHHVPVVATRGGGQVDAVGDRGLLCGVGDAPCLAEKMDRLLSDPAFADELAERAEVWARENVSIAAVTARYLPLYAELAKAHPLR